MPRLRNILFSQRRDAAARPVSTGMEGTAEGGMMAGMKDKLGKQMDKTKFGRNIHEASRTERGRRVLQAGADMAMTPSDPITDIAPAADPRLGQLAEPL